VGELEELKPGDPRRIGPYWLEARLGAGGMGRVYLARSPGGRKVAVKAIRAELAESADFRARFAREVSAARTVSGIFTVPVVDADLDGPVPWLATAYQPGPSLAEAVTGSGPLPVSSVLSLAAGLAEGLAAIHAAGVIHRDLKPSNVILAEDGPRLIDFGISRAVEATALTHTGMVVGTPGFMSPEQAEGRDVGRPSDVFSLGAVLAFAATGRGPFGEGSTAALIYRVVYAEPETAGLPEQIRPLIERCLAKDPQHRPTAADLLAELSTEPGRAPAAGRPAGPPSQPAAAAPPSHPATEQVGPGLRPTDTADQPAGRAGQPVTAAATRGPGLADPPVTAAPPRPARRRWLIPVVTACVVAGAAAGAFAALRLSHTPATLAPAAHGAKITHRPQHAKPAHNSPNDTGTGTGTGTGAETGAGSGSTPLPPAQLHIDGTPIGVSAVNTDPDMTGVADTLGTYFGGINAGNYLQAWNVYSPAEQASNPFQTWSSGESSSQISQVVVQSIQHHPSGDLDAVVVFQSHQAAQQGHDGETCTNWSLDYQLVPSAGGSPPYLINKATEAGAGPVAC
jgi:protein kinase-like protein